LQSSDEFVKAEDKMYKMKYFLAKIDTAHYLLISHFIGTISPDINLQGSSQL